jgi:hypothetical protein
MQPGDIPECVELVANHPVIGPRYGPVIELLPEAWLRFLQCEARAAMVIFPDESPDAPICFLGTTITVHDDFLRELKTPPHFWVGPELTKRIAGGRSPILTPQQLREQNAANGLNMVCWEGFVRPGYEAHSELHHYMMSVFIEAHQGYFWKEIITNQPESADRLTFLLRTGAALWDPATDGYTPTSSEDPREVIRKPHVLGVTRELEFRGRGAWAGSWTGGLFDYHPPILGFSPAEQRLLAAALPGATDTDLAGALGASLPAVKKMWVSIYRRVAECLPELIPDPLGQDIPASGRGLEKRRGLLAYMREHPEELRPFSRKLVYGRSPRR